MTDSKVGTPIPEMQLAHSEGGSVHFPSDLQGKWTVLYFYPKDDTPGCTKQACAYRDNYSIFKEMGVVLYGVSMDNLESHDHFKMKFSLNFPLLSDGERKLSEALGVYGEQKWGDKTYMGLSRDTFLIGPDATVRQVWRKVDPVTTVSETLAAVQEFAK